MKTHDNTLYVTTQGAYLSKNGTNVVVSVDRKEVFRAPLHTIGNIVCFGNVGCSPFLMGLCGRENVGIAFLTENGRFLARTAGPQSGNVLLRRSQHVITSDPECAAGVARGVVVAKLTNARMVLQRALRDHADKIQAEPVSGAVKRLLSLTEELAHPLSLERIRGVEGEAAQYYFQAFDHLILCQKKDFFFKSRSRRPPLDNVNALLSFIYVLLANDVRSACESVGLDPQMGFLHADRPGRPSLALDLMEEFRPVLADRLALSLVNRQQVQAKEFRQQESGGVEMNEKARKTLLTAYQKRKGETVYHPFLNEKITVGILPFVQARLLARFLRGDYDAYPPFFWR